MVVVQGGVGDVLRQLVWVRSAQVISHTSKMVVVFVPIVCHSYGQFLYLNGFAFKYNIETFLRIPSVITGVLSPNAVCILQHNIMTY